MKAGATARMRLTVHDLAEGIAHPPGGKGRKAFLYVSEGRAFGRNGEAAYAIGADDGRFVEGPVRVEAGASAWLFTVTPVEDGTGPGDVVLSEPVDMGFAGPYLLRADRIESPAGASTPRHGHRGPGLRRLVAGRLNAAVGERIARIEPGGAWFETGTEPVVGTNVGTDDTVFIRLMILPAELEGGRSSFVPMNDERAGRPRSVGNRLFQEIYLDAHDTLARAQTASRPFP